MSQGLNLVRVFSGSPLTVNLLREELENMGIESIIKDEFGSAVVAGFAGGVPSVVDLYIQESDMKESEPLIQEFIRQSS